MCLPCEVEQCRFSEMDLGLGGEALGMAEWLHFMLLRATWNNFSTSRPSKCNQTSRKTSGYQDMESTVPNRFPMLGSTTSGYCTLNVSIIIVYHEVIGFQRIQRLMRAKKIWKSQLEPWTSWSECTGIPLNLHHVPMGWLCRLAGPCRIEASTPSHVAAKHLNRHLRKALEDFGAGLGGVKMRYYWHSFEMWFLQTSSTIQVSERSPSQETQRLWTHRCSDMSQVWIWGLCYIYIYTHMSQLFVPCLVGFVNKHFEVVFEISCLVTVQGLINDMIYGDDVLGELFNRDVGDSWTLQLNLRRTQRSWGGFMLPSSTLTHKVRDYQ